MFALSKTGVRAHRSAFTLVELIAVMVVLAILAGVAAPRFFSYGDQARTAALEGSLGGMRSAIAQYYAVQSTKGDAVYPTLIELSKPGIVMQEALPKNPFNGLSEIKQVTSRSNAIKRNVANEKKFGWNYFYDNTSDPPIAIIWANSKEETMVKDVAGKLVKANDI